MKSILNLDRTRLGLCNAALGAVFFAVMGAFIYAAQLRSMETSSLVSSFGRIAINFVLLAIPYLLLGKGRVLIGDLRPSLFLRGLFGSAALMTYFGSIQAIGIGESAFLRSSNAVFIALLAPLILRERNSLIGWIAIIGSLLGLNLLLQPRLEDVSTLGRLLGVSSGLFAALAWLMAARSGRSNEAVTIVFHFCAIGTLLHLLILPFMDVTWPTDPMYWLYITIAGCLAAGGQIFQTRAYNMSPAHLNGAVGYISPVVSMLLGIMVFARFPDMKAWVGAAIVLLCGLILPFVRRAVRLEPQHEEPIGK